MAYNYITLEEQFDLSRYNVLDSMMLFYAESMNRFVNPFENEIIHDIHRLLAPWQIELFKARRANCTFPDVTNSFLIDLVYPNHLNVKYS